jgi:GNAT superfamily N-acetyltransferase
VAETAFEWRAENPTPETFLSLRAAGGMGARTPEAAAKAVTGALYSLMLFNAEKAIGMGRILGDGGVFVMLTDVVIHPDFQGQGLGREMMQRLNAWCDATLPPSCFVGLIARPGVEPFYEAIGFDRVYAMERYLPVPVLDNQI